MTKHVSDRFWETCVLQVLRKINKGFKPSEVDLTVIGALYERAEGSWVALASGDTDSWGLLRQCAKVYLRRKLTKDEDHGDG